MSEHAFCNKCGTRLQGADQSRGTCPRCLLGLGLETPHLDLSGGARPSPESPELDEIAALLPRYDLLEVLGRGGMGVVYKARQKDLQRIVAIKVLLPDLGKDPAFAERFLREAQALANLNHQGIVDVYDFGQADGVYYFVMEYVDGANLRQLSASQELGPKETLGIVTQICGALQYAHDRGIVHRDVKPENILVDRQGRVKITDFGLAKLSSRMGDAVRLTRSDQVMGTLHYMAPEQIERPQQVDHRADLYSLGVVFYELLTGELPLGRFQPPSSRAEMDGRLDEVVMRALEKEPEQRYQAASQIETEIERISSTEAQSVSARAPVRRPIPVHESPRHGSSNRWIWIPVVAVLGILVVGVLFAFLFVAGSSVSMSGVARSQAEIDRQLLASHSGQLRYDDDLHPRVTSGPLLDALGPRPSTCSQFELAMSELREDYLPLEHAVRVFEHAVETYETGRGIRGLKLRVGEFPEERQKLQRAFVQQVGPLLGPAGQALLDERFFQELMPFGQRRVTINVREPTDGMVKWRPERDDYSFEEKYWIVGETRMPPYWVRRMLRDFHAFERGGPMVTALRSDRREGERVVTEDGGVSASSESQRSNLRNSRPSQSTRRAPQDARSTANRLLSFLGLGCVGFLVLVIALIVLVARRKRSRAPHERA